MIGTVINAITKILQEETNAIAVKAKKQQIAN